MTLLGELQPFEQSFSIVPSDDSGEKNNYYLSPPSTSMSASSDTYLLETFHQYPHGDFRPTFYNPFEIKHRRRTSRVQLKILEKSFSENAKPNASIRRSLAQKLDMTPRGVQIWFQNRRAKAKLLKKKMCHPQQENTTVELEEGDDNEEEAEDGNEKEQSSLVEKEQINLQFPSSGDINQSSILFSQFFTSPNQKNQPIDQQWPPWKTNALLNDHVRNVATKAAAIAAASSSSRYQPMIRGSSSFVNITEYENRANDTRRRSCPTPGKHTMMMSTDMQYSYLSPSWPPSMLSKNNAFYSKGDLSFSQQQNCCYSDIHLAYQQQQRQFQLTPPLTASCSASTVAGSPISLDNLYNDPIILPQQANHLYCPVTSSPAALVGDFYEF